MVSSVLALMLAASAMQSDTTRSAREAFTGCLRAYMNHAIEAHTSAADFGTQYPQQCTTQEATYRNSVIARETAIRATRSSAEQTARDEIDETRTNFRERFEMAIDTAPPAHPATQPAAQPAAAPAAATPPATPAAAPAATPH
jgi:hypothetical protein